MPLQDPDELVVAGFGRIYVAPVGTTLPTDPTALLNGAFIELGYVTEDGVTLTSTPTVEEFKAWQSRSVIRRSLTAIELQAKFSLMQWDADTIKFAFGGGTVTALGGGKYKFAFVDDTAQLDEKAMVIEWNDGTKNYRCVIARGSITDSTETQLQRTAVSELPITFKAITAEGATSIAYLLSNDPAWDPTGS